MNEDNMQPPMRMLQIQTVPENEIDLPSQFGDDDALLSVASPETNFVAIHAVSVTASSRPESDSANSSTTSGLKSSELRKRSSVGSNLLKYQSDDSSSHRRKSFHLNTMGLIGREEEISILRSAFDRILLQSKEDETKPISDEEDLEFAKNEIVFLGGPSGVGK